MTIATSDKYIYLQTNLGTVAIPYAAPSAGEPYINFPDGAGGFIAQKYAAPAEGEPFAYIPTNDGRFVALKIGDAAAPLPNELNLTVVTFPTVTTQHFWLVDWDSVAGTYDGTYVEYSTAGFSTNYGEGTKICEENSLVSACNAWTTNPDSMHYFTAWGVSSTTPVSTSRSCAKLMDPSALCTYIPTSTHAASTSFSLIFYTGCTGSVSRSGKTLTINFSGTSTVPFTGFSAFQFNSTNNQYAKGNSVTFSRSDASINVFSLVMSRDIWDTSTDVGITYGTTAAFGTHSQTFEDYAHVLGYQISACYTTKLGSFSVALEDITWTS